MSAAQTAAAPIPFLIREVIATIADRPYESEATRQARATGAAELIEAFAPEDGVDMMLTGQAVVCHSLLLDTARDTHRTTAADLVYRGRQQVLATAKLQLSYLKEIARRRNEHAVSAPAPRPVRVVNTPKPAAAPPVQPVAPAATPKPPQPPEAGSQPQAPEPVAADVTAAPRLPQPDPILAMTDRAAVMASAARIPAPPAPSSAPQRPAPAPNR